jgi:hypothetical protein
LGSADGCTRYAVFGSAVGLNTHVPVDTATVVVVNGRPVGFEFYTDHDEKYRSRKEEWLDILHPKRVRSIGSVGCRIAAPGSPNTKKAGGTIPPAFLCSCLMAVTYRRPNVISGPEAGVSP